MPTCDLPNPGLTGNKSVLPNGYAPRPQPLNRFWHYVGRAARNECDMSTAHYQISPSGAALRGPLPARRLDNPENSHLSPKAALSSVGQAKAWIFFICGITAGVANDFNNCAIFAGRLFPRNRQQEACGKHYVHVPLQRRQGHASA
jgi:hypothetical protein